MRVAIITPVPLLADYTEIIGSDHLVLAHLVLTSKIYTDYYRQRSNDGHFILLDNSAHELGDSIRTDLLIETARRVNASEIALPDRVFFGDDTLRTSQAAIQTYRRELPKTSVMGIPQGRVAREFYDCFEGLCDLGIDTIGLSKDYEVWPGGLLGIVLEMRRRRGAEIPIHLLGWGRELYQLYLLGKQKEVLNIRSCDSAKPIVYAAAGIQLPLEPTHDVPEYPRRPGNFFQLSQKDLDKSIVSHNIDAFKIWAGGGS